MVSKSFCVILFVILATSATCELSTTIRPTPERTCSTKLSSCEVDGKVEILGRPGKAGPVGPKGDRGKVGSIGPTGKEGLRGKKGERGLKGDHGISGLNGTTGAIGPKGDNGRQGVTGVKGEKGEKGNKSLGPKGDPGLRGIAGACGCIQDDDEEKKKEKSASAVATWATKDNPGQVPCRNAPEHNLTTEFYYLKDGFQVKCDFKTKLTCISSTKHTPFFYKQNQPFWLSSENVTLQEIYDLDSVQLSWLQKQSFTAEMTIRYHCLNSKPFGSNSMVLLTWNDIKIGPESTNTTPFHYYVNKDGCSSAPEGKWNFTDIVLVSPIAQRLPIIDFFIRDVRYTDQALRIEIKNLCFG